jgi:DNA-binding HxlR family transcriptional regulator
VLARTDYKEVPPRVDYALTPLGKTLKPVIAALAAWGEENISCRPSGRHLRDVAACDRSDAAAPVEA